MLKLIKYDHLPCFFFFRVPSIQVVVGVINPLAPREQKVTLR